MRRLSTRSYQEVLHVCLQSPHRLLQINDPDIEKREVNQQNRIEQGVRSGQSTPK